MLNRRVLRVKAFQALFSYKQAQDSNINRAKEFLEEKFEPDLNSMVVQDKRKLRLQKGRAVALFEKYFRDNKEIECDDDELATALDDSIAHYHNLLAKDKENIKKFMLEDIENTYVRYLKVLKLPVALSDFVNIEQEEKNKKRYVRDSSRNIRLLENKAIDVLRKDEALNKQCEKYKVSWAEDLSFVRQLFKESLIKTDEYLEYISKPKDPIFEDDKAILQHIMKEVIFNYEPFHAFIEEEDLQWHENFKIVKGMAVKTVKNVEENEVPLLRISVNWEDDKAFFEGLFESFISRDKDLDKIISTKLENWDIERVATTDKIIIKTAIAEMLEFPSIPVKVTINEFIELSKDYSTPKSKHFINGVLDRTSKELVDKGTIKKSGRGLIDNK